MPSLPVAHPGISYLCTGALWQEPRSSLSVDPTLDLMSTQQL